MCVFFYKKKILHLYFIFHYVITRTNYQLKKNNKMKTTTIFTISLLLVGIVSVLSGRVQATSMAVLVVGLETDAASDVFAAGIRYEFGQKGYTIITTPAVTAKQTELRNLHKQNPPVDTAGLAAWGKTNNIDFVQLVVEKDCTITIDGVSKSGREQLAQVVSCGTTKYPERSYYRTRFVPSLANVGLGTEFDEMIYVSGGVFEMGWKNSTRDGTPFDDSEKPVHYVKVNSFYMGKYEVTQALWKKVMGSLPSSVTGNYAGDNKPVVFVSWGDITGSGGFLETLNKQTGKNYRLPTEAEWEYAARGCFSGNCENYQYSGSNTVGDVAWYSGNRLGAYCQPVGTKSPNVLGFYNMAGNAWEWCSDWHSAAHDPSGTASSPQDNPTGATSGSSRVHRGGSYADAASSQRVAHRGRATPSIRSGNLGFRLV
jgi:formylglycine-generating enzyme required for sulfatase activity